MLNRKYLKTGVEGALKKRKKKMPPLMSLENCIEIKTGEPKNPLEQIENETKKDKTSLKDKLNRKRMSINEKIEGNKKKDDIENEN